MSKKLTSFVKMMPVVELNLCKGFLFSMKEIFGNRNFECRKVKAQINTSPLGLEHFMEHQIRMLRFFRILKSL